MTEFTWTPEFGSSGDYNPSVIVNRFGDGYEQRIAQSMNAVSSTWSLSFNNRESDEAAAILAFLLARAGTEAFNWTPPGEDTALVFVCRKWSQTPAKAERKSITATFEEVFEP